jgi:anti-sigma factor RsiW
VAEDHFEGLLISYLLGELSVEEERELELHLEECPECRRELDWVRQTHALLRQLATYEPPTELEGKVLAQVRGEMPIRSSGGWWLWVSAAAVLLVVAVLGIGILREITGDSTTSVPLTATALAPEAGGQARVEQEGENFQVELEVWKMPDLEEDEYYEMWSNQLRNLPDRAGGPDNREPHGPCDR